MTTTDAPSPKPTTIVVLLLTALLLAGCSRTSIKLAIENQQRADDVAEHIVDQQHEALKILLFRDTAAKLAAGADVTETLNQAWNDRDRFEFWRVQYERAKMVRFVGVDLALYANQAVFDLFWKAIQERIQTGKQAIAAAAGAALTNP